MATIRPTALFHTHLLKADYQKASAILRIHLKLNPSKLYGETCVATAGCQFATLCHFQLNPQFATFIMVSTGICKKTNKKLNQ
jgi:hypothetical protein